MSNYSENPGYTLDIYIFPLHELRQCDLPISSLLKIDDNNSCIWRAFPNDLFEHAGCVLKIFWFSHLFWLFLHSSISFNNCNCHIFHTNLALIWFQCCPSYLSRKKGISGTFLSLGLQPRLQKYSLDSLFSTLVTLTTLQSDEDKFVLRLGSTIIKTKY